MWDIACSACVRHKKADAGVNSERMNEKKIIKMRHVNKRITTWV